ncbi:hypothetical protein [Desulfobulbus propionicus]|jgi:hypothetical protein
MKYQGMLVCLTLLIAPALNTTPRTCMVISITEEIILLQCTGNSHLRVNDLVRLRAVNK